MRLSALLIIALSLVATVLTGCGRASVAGTPAGGDFRLWQDASIFTPVTSLLTQAGSGEPLWLEMYEFDRPDLESALVDAERRGADVRVIVDRTVPESAGTADRLAARGLQVRAYPVDDARHQIDHVKLLIAGKTALMGGMNWGRHSAANHDYAFETARPDVLQRFAAIFRQDWSLAGGHPDPLQVAPGPVAQTTPGEEVRALLLAAIVSARRSVAAEVFVLTDPDVMLAMSAAVRRGVRVRLLLDPAQDSNLSPFRLLLRSGVEARWYPVPPGSKLHAKAGLFDGIRLLVGSANWTVSGLSVNHELDLMVEDQAAARAFADRFERDWTVSG